MRRHNIRIMSRRALTLAQNINRVRREYHGTRDHLG
jgi:hypothetical protein